MVGTRLCLPDQREYVLEIQDVDNAADKRARSEWEQKSRCEGIGLELE